MGFPDLYCRPYIYCLPDSYRLSNFFLFNSIFTVYPIFFLFDPIFTVYPIFPYFYSLPDFFLFNPIFYCLPDFLIVTKTRNFGLSFYPAMQPGQKVAVRPNARAVLSYRYNAEMKWKHLQQYASNNGSAVAAV